MNTTAGSVNGDAAADAAQVKDHLRAARDAATNAARQRAQQAQEWGRSQLNDVQERIEAQPYRAAALALGIGLLAGILLSTFARRSN
jgi:ElaB/YqjD/DUF883 family membrane-anchored ribosome-binding protein